MKNHPVISIFSALYLGFPRSLGLDFPKQRVQGSHKGPRNFFIRFSRFNPMLLKTIIICVIFINLCNLCFPQQCNIIYITPTGASSGAAGSITNPASLSYGLSLANPFNNQLWLAAGNYTISNTLNLISGVTMEGGFDPTTWIKSNSQTTVIYRNNSNIQTAPNRLVAISCVGISNFRLHDLTVIVADAVGNGVTTYGVQIDSCYNYSITRCNINAGNGTDGSDGISGTGGVNGANGLNGQNGDGDGGCCTAGGAGASGSFPGSNGGGNGGNGGPRGSGTSLCFGSGNDAPDGLPGQNGIGSGGGAGGSGGNGYCDNICLSMGCDAGSANNGDDGLPGADGAIGANGLPGVPLFSNFFIQGTGQDGQIGEHGSGGGGGGGGGSQGCLWSLFGNYNGAGAGGGGGGEGGQGGSGAAGGTGGGGSFGIYIYANSINTEIKDCYTYSGIPGYGGLGGSPGGASGAGGTGGIGGNQPSSPGYDCDLGVAGDGGTGGTGGTGGNGGNGTPGISLPIFEDPGGIAAAQSDMSSPVEPEIFVKSTGCTYSDIEYTTNATGIILWYFDGGTIPLSATGNSATVQYTIMGRHSITLVVNGVPYIFTDFVGIFSDGTPYLPYVQSADSVICPGDFGSFSSSYAGLAYEWTVYDNTITTYTTPTIIHNFPTDEGTYEVHLQTESPCCGWSKIDTFEVNVVPFLEPGIYVAATSTRICDGDQVTFGAVPVNGGTNPTYQWLVNSSVSGTSSSLTTSALNDGDVVTCIMTSSYPCPLNGVAIAASAPLTINVNPLPIVNCISSKFYLGANTLFGATPTVGTPPFTYNWDFGDSGIDTGATTTHYYGATGTYSYSVSVTDSNGCTGYCNGSLTIVVAPFVAAGFMSNVIQACDSVTVTFIDTSIGNPGSWYWDFGDGTIDTLSGDTVVHTYNTSGAYSVILAATNGVYTDTVTHPNSVMVYASPVAGLSAIEQPGCHPFNPQFLDCSYGATSWQWDFGDGGNSTLQNPNHPYGDTGSYIVTLITGSNNYCYDTASISITSLPSPTAGFSSGDTLVCIESLVQFIDTSSDAISWYWDFGDGNTSIDITPSNTYYYPGSYTVSLTVENQFGCSDILTMPDMITVLPNPVPQFTAVPQLTTNLNPTIYFTDVSTGDSLAGWSWNFDDEYYSDIQNPVHTYADTGSYTVELLVTDKNGCEEVVSLIVRINPDYIFFIPNVFTPNKDELNEVFLPIGEGIDENHYKMYIFNRWGDEIFYTDDPYLGWDGTANDGRELAQSEVYVWLIITRDLLGKTHQYNGHVTLVR
ncbi:MAG: PKD domain-containing protein [Bacteroidota bacterium]